jgi:hypothetical protein
MPQAHANNATSAVGCRQHPPHGSHQA